MCELRKPIIASGKKYLQVHVQGLGIRIIPLCTDVTLLNF